MLTPKAYMQLSPNMPVGPNMLVGLFLSKALGLLLC